MDEQALSELVTQKVREWFASQENQKDGYEYERSLNEVVQEIGKSILEASAGKLPSNRKEKKTLDEFREYNDTEKSFLEYLGRKF